MHSNRIPVSDNKSFTLTPSVGMTKGFASNKRVYLGSKTGVGWVIRGGFLFSNVLQCELFSSEDQRELVCLHLKAWYRGCSEGT